MAAIVSATTCPAEPKPVREVGYYDASDDQIAAYLAIAEPGYHASEKDVRAYFEIKREGAWFLRTPVWSKPFMDVVEFVNRHHLWHQMQDPSYEMAMFVWGVMQRRAWAAEQVWTSGNAELFLMGYAQARCARVGESEPAPTPIETLHAAHLRESQKIFNKLIADDEAGKEHAAGTSMIHYTMSKRFTIEQTVALHAIHFKDPERVAKFTAATGIVNTRGKVGEETITKLLFAYAGPDEDGDAPVRWMS